MWQCGLIYHFDLKSIKYKKRPEESGRFNDEYQVYIFVKVFTSVPLLPVNLMR